MLVNLKYLVKAILLKTNILFLKGQLQEEKKARYPCGSSCILPRLTLVLRKLILLLIAILELQVKMFLYFSCLVMLILLIQKMKFCLRFPFDVGASTFKRLRKAVLQISGLGSVNEYYFDDCGLADKDQKLYSKNKKQKNYQANVF